MSLSHYHAHSLRCVWILSFVLAFISTSAQDTLAPVELDSVVVRAFDRNARLRDVAAPVSYLNGVALQRFGTASVVEAVNATPGVRLEERSPGSYRFAIRGSALRSPFGVRNVKVYYNDLPLTDPSGQTYLNALGAYDFGSMEIIKGSGSSFYGAGTGGVLLINSPVAAGNDLLLVEHTVGSYGLQNSAAALHYGSSAAQNRLSFQHQQSNGYRTQSALNRNSVNWSARIQTGETGILNATFLYSNLHYETPGALTLTEYANNPKDARPASGIFPSALAANASINQHNFLAGASYTQELAPSLQNKTAVYGAFTQLHNPAIRNYGSNSEPHVGARSVFTWQPILGKNQFTASAGAEWQQGFANYQTLENNGGAPGALQQSNAVKNKQFFVFANAAYEVAAFRFEAGASVNKYQLHYQSFFPATTTAQERTFSNEIAPRFSALWMVKNLRFYTSIAKGFSSPTVAETIPTGSAVNLALNAEKGVTIDAGFRGTILNFLYADVNMYRFVLHDAIVQRRDAGGGDYYENAGNTRQYGLEASLRKTLFVKQPQVQSAIWMSYTWNYFRYAQFKQFTTEYSGNAMPGVAPHVFASGFDVMYARAFANLSYYFSDRLPLNDANTAYLKAYHIASAKLGYKLKSSNRIVSSVALGANNLFDAKYSLGADINAAGGRYYNGAPERNYYATVSFQLLKPAGQ